VKLLLALLLLAACKDEPANKPPTPVESPETGVAAETLTRAQAEVDRIEKAMAALEEEITREVTATKSVKTAAEREAALARSTALEAKVTELDRQLDAAKATITKAARPLGNEIEQLQRAKEKIDREMLALVERIEQAATPAARDAATAELEKLRLQAAEIAENLRQIAAKKP
jgi:phosphoglycerate-specific signal transduction histidine kinase